MLNGDARRPLRLHDVADAEGLARDALNEQLRAWGAYLQPCEYEDALAYLVALAWELAGAYDRARSAQLFSTYAGRLLRRRLADWYRTRFGSSRNLHRPQLLSLDQLHEQADRKHALTSAGDPAELLVNLA